MEIIFASLKISKLMNLFFGSLTSSENMDFIFCKLQKYQKTWISILTSLMKRHAIGAGPSCLVNLQRFGSWAAWATHIACLFIQACKKKMKFMFFEDL